MNDKDQVDEGLIQGEGTGSIISFNPSSMGTGNQQEEIRSRKKIVPFGNYEVVICLDEDDRFLGIDQIRISKDFLSLEQNIKYRGYFDIEDLYEEEKE